MKMIISAAISGVIVEFAYVSLGASLETASIVGCIVFFGMLNHIKD